MSEPTPYTESGAVAASMEMMRATGDLLKSLARFSWAMSVYTAHQTVNMMTSNPLNTNGAGSMNDIAAAASSRLSGPVRTAYAIGTNLQSGLIDFAFNSSGFGPKGQKAPGTADGLSVSMVTGGRRRVAGVSTVSSGAVHRPVLQTELVETLTRYQAEASGNPADLQSIVVGLWKTEGFSTTVGKYLLPENTLSDPGLPRQALPIAHVGFGSGSTESLAFDVAGLKRLFTERAAPEFREFSFEGIGAILRLYERGFFKVMSGALGLIPLDAPDGPDPAGFFKTYLSQFTTEIQRLITHGYGRIIAFSNMNIYKALEEITTLPPERVGPAAHGAGFAFAIMNSPDMARMLEQSAVPFDPPVRAEFQNGLVYSLVFFDWYVPGLLQSWRAAGPVEAELVEHARKEAALSRQRGYPLAFRLQNPRG